MKFKHLTYIAVYAFILMQNSIIIAQNKNVSISAHGNSLRALCKFLFKISDDKINQFEIPTGNPLLISFDKNIKIENINYLDKTRQKKIFTNQ